MKLSSKCIGIWFHQGVVLLGGLLLMVVGITRGEVSVVLHKAVQICLECIGIG